MAIDQYGQIIRRSPRPIPINTVPYIHSNDTATFDNGGLNLWDRYDNFIRRIGNWFAEYAETITGIIAIVICAIGAIGFISWLVSLGLFWGIVAGLFLGGIAYYAVLVIAGIFIFIGNVSLGIVRYVFYNGWTFLITLVIILGLLIFSGNSNQSLHSRTSTASPVPTTSITTTSYRCVAKILNVRSGPGAGYNVIGKIYRGQTVNVVDDYIHNDDFVKILYNNREGYVSKKYILK